MLGLVIFFFAMAAFGTITRRGIQGPDLPWDVVMVATSTIALVLSGIVLVPVFF